MHQLEKESLFTHTSNNTPQWKGSTDTRSTTWIVSKTVCVFESRQTQKGKRKKTYRRQYNVCGSEKGKTTGTKIQTTITTGFGWEQGTDYKEL